MDTLQKRIADCRDEILPILKKYGVDIGSQVMWVDTNVPPPTPVAVEEDLKEETKAE